MGEVISLGRAIGLVVDILILVAIVAMIIGVLIWWLHGCFQDTERAKRYQHSMFVNADCADEWLNKYYAEKKDHSDSVSFYTGALERKDRKIEAMGKMDEQRIKRIKRLEEQLRENGIEPEEWDFA